jgi:hypothetical protein
MPTCLWNGLVACNFQNLQRIETQVYVLEFDGKHTGIQITTSGSEESQHFLMHKHPSLLKF